MMQIAFKLGLHDLKDEEPAAVFRDQRMDEKLLGIFLPYLPKGTPPQKARLFAQQFFGGLFFLVFAADQICPAANLCEPSTYLAQLVQTFAADPEAALKGAV
jgi:hypothetical protein